MSQKIPIRDPRRTAVIFSLVCAYVLALNGYFLCTEHNIYAGTLVLCSILGGLVGWAIAVLATPFDEKEAIRFSEYLKVTSAFLSGFIFTKLNEILTVADIKSFLSNANNLAQVGYACGYTLAFFLIGLMWTFLVRRYTRAIGEA